MAPTELIIASASAVLVPAFAGPLLSRIPGGPIGIAAVGAGMVYAGMKIKNGMLGAALIGTGAGLAVAVIAQMVIRPTATATA